MKQEEEGLSPLMGCELQILCQSSETMQEGWASEFSVRLQVEYYLLFKYSLKILLFRC